MILGSHAADPTGGEDLSTLTVQLADGSETTLNVLDNTYKAALSGEDWCSASGKARWESFLWGFIDQTHTGDGVSSSPLLRVW